MSSSPPPPAAVSIENRGMDWLRETVRVECGLPGEAFHPVERERIPAPARQLLDHAEGMTATLEAFHRRKLQVDILREFDGGEFYGREIFLRTIPERRIVEYGVIAVRLEEFSPEQQAAIRTGELPFGLQLERFAMPFASVPAYFFTLAPAAVAHTPLGQLGGTGSFYGRCSRLARPAGRPLAWIMEIPTA